MCGRERGRALSECLIVKVMVRGGQCGKINQTAPVIQEGPKSCEFLKILYTNSDTLTNKMDELKTLNSSEKADVIAIT